jgi:hypothetical protein
MVALLQEKPKGGRPRKPDHELTPNALRARARYHERKREQLDHGNAGNKNAVGRCEAIIQTHCGFAEPPAWHHTLIREMDRAVRGFWLNPAKPWRRELARPTDIGEHKAHTMARLTFISRTRRAVPGHRNQIETIALEIEQGWEE